LHPIKVFFYVSKCIEGCYALNPKVLVIIYFGVDYFIIK